MRSLMLSPDFHTMSFAAAWSRSFRHLRRVTEARKFNLRCLSTEIEEKIQPCNIKSSKSWISETDRFKYLRKSINKAELNEFRAAQCCDIQQISEKILDRPATFIVFDIETNGFNPRDHRTIEIGFRDLYGGTDSTFQTLINPGQAVKNVNIHGITSSMVNRHGVPKFHELLPIILQFIRSRQIDGKPVALFAHNARGFDVPFLAMEFKHCSMKIPEDWLFIDTLPIARQLMKQNGSKLASLDVLRTHYEIPLVGPAHRVLQDVTTLSYVLQRMTNDLKLTIPQLLEGGFRASDLNVKKPVPNKR